MVYRFYQLKSKMLKKTENKSENNRCECNQCLQKLTDVFLKYYSEKKEKEHFIFV